MALRWMVVASGDRLETTMKAKGHHRLDLYVSEIRSWMKVIVVIRREGENRWRM